MHGQLLAAQQHGVATYETVDELLARGAVDLVVVATPHDTHCQIACQVMDAGKHCIVEKIMCLNGAEAERLASLEGIVARGALAYIEVGNALLAIRDERLYRQTHARFADYLREKWDLSRSHGYQLIDAAGIAQLVCPPLVDTDDEGSTDALAREYGLHLVDEPDVEVSTIVDTLPPPSSEGVARRLAAAAKTDPDRARNIWKQAVAEHGPQATASQVAAVANGHPAREAWEEEMRKLASDLRTFCKTKDPADARRALARWRPMYSVLDDAGRVR